MIQKKTDLNTHTDSLEVIDAIQFVSSVEVIEGGNVVESINFEESAEPSTNVTVKRKRGRPKMSEEQRAEIMAKREAGKTRRFAVGEEPNRRSQ